MTFRDDCAAAFKEKSYRIFPAKAFRNLRARFLFRSKDSFYFARVRREQPRAFATFQHRRFAGKNIERIGIDHHRLPRRLNERQSRRRVRGPRPGPTAHTSIDSLGKSR